MKFIPKTKLVTTRKELMADEIKKPWPKARVLNDTQYETCDNSGTMILEKRDIVEIVGRYFGNYIILILNHEERPEELLMEISNLELVES